MKRFTVLCMLFAFVTVANAQWVVNTMDSIAANSYFQFPEPGDLHGLGTGQSYATLSDETSDVKSGTGALKVEWHVNYTESWGGFAQLMHLNSTEETSPEYMQYFDMSMATHISIWYNNLTPSSKPGSVHMRFKLHEAGGASTYWTNATDHEDWYFETAVPYDDTPGWKELLIPLEVTGPTGASPNDQGFSLPTWSGVTNNEQLDLDKIIGFSIECTTPLTGGEVAEGVILWDQLTLVGAKYPPLTTFDNTAATDWTIDKMDWDAAAMPISKLNLSDETTDKFEGESALKVEYKAVASQSWGGYVNFEHKFDQPINLAAHTDLYIAIKNVIPNNLTGRLTARFVLYDNSGSGTESWYTLFDCNIEEAFDWKTVRIPLEFSSSSDWELAPGVFKNPPDQGNDDGVLGLSAIGGFKIEYSIDATAAVGTDVTAEGTMLFDFLIPSGFRETDKTAPEAPQGVVVVPGAYSNLITWSDVPGESSEKYSLYFSTSPITDISAPGVNQIATESGASIPEGVGVANHVLRAPLTDQEVSYYYAVVCTDKAGNIGAPGSTGGAVKNTAQGVPIVAVATPTFTADGDLGEFSGIRPFNLSVEKGTATPAPNSFIDNDADCSANIYLAIDGENLYVGMDVEDDIVNPESQASSYLNDAPDLFIGMYNMSGALHGALQRGASPDYHIRFHKNHIRIEGGGSDTDSLLTPGDNYYWQEKFPSGYIVEAKIPLDYLMNKRSNSDQKTDQIYVKEGFRIPIDFEINDNDATGNREGMLCYSPNNRDLSYSDVWRWSTTWIGDKWTPITGVENNNLPESYSISQNYPNPFNPTTQIQYSIEKPGNVSLIVYDVLGRKVAELVNGYQQSGNYTVNFDGSKLASGMYIYKIESGSFSSIKKMMLMK